jgi:diguanylate cyclase (GGDEF)-like protein
VLEEKERLAAELQRANTELAQQAASDGLTGLANKRALEQALARDLARADREKTVLSLVVVDVDHFKRVNDTHGHSVGDAVLRAVAALLQGALRKGDFVARYGGEEFVLVLPVTDTPQAMLVADRLRARLAQAAIPYDGGTLTVTASFGVSSVRGPGCAGAAAELFERSDKALYLAKGAGRNCVRYLESSGNH